MKTFAVVVEVVRSDKDEPVVTLVRSTQGNVLDVCPLEFVGSSISDLINSSKHEQK